MISEKNMRRKTLLSGTVIALMAGAGLLVLKHNRPSAEPRPVEGTTVHVAVATTASPSPTLTATAATGLSKKPGRDVHGFYAQDLPLSVAEEKTFFKEAESLFLVDLPQTTDRESLMPRVIQLNERNRRGVRSAFNLLAHSPKSDSELRSRMAMVDYLLYRSAWDPTIETEIRALISKPVPREDAARYQAVALGDRVELVAGLTRIDPVRALTLARDAADPIVKKRAPVEIFLRLQASGMNDEEAIKLVREHFPKFSGQVKEVPIPASGKKKPQPTYGQG